MAESVELTVPVVAGTGAAQIVRLARPCHSARWLPEEAVTPKRCWVTAASLSADEAFSLSDAVTSDASHPDRRCRRRQRGPPIGPDSVSALSRCARLGPVGVPEGPVRLSLGEPGRHVR